MAVGHVDPLFEVGDKWRTLTEGVKGFKSGVHKGLALFVNSCLGALEVAFAGCGSWTAGRCVWQPPTRVKDKVLAISRWAEQAVEAAPVAMSGLDQAAVQVRGRALGGLVSQAQNIP